MPKIAVSEIDSAIRNSIARLKTEQQLRLKGPIVNGIVVDEITLAGAKPLAVARELLRDVPVDDRFELLPKVTKLPNKQLLIGYVVNPNRV